MSYRRATLICVLYAVLWIAAGYDAVVVLGPALA